MRKVYSQVGLVRIIIRILFWVGKGRSYILKASTGMPAEGIALEGLLLYLLIKELFIEVIIPLVLNNKLVNFLKSSNLSIYNFLQCFTPLLLPRRPYLFLSLRISSLKLSLSYQFPNIFPDVLNWIYIWRLSWPEKSNNLSNIKNL